MPPLLRGPSINLSKHSHKFILFLNTEDITLNFLSAFSVVNAPLFNAPLLYSRCVVLVVGARAHYDVIITDQVQGPCGWVCAHYDVIIADLVCGLCGWARAHYDIIIAEQLRGPCCQSNCACQVELRL